MPSSSSSSSSSSTRHGARIAQTTVDARINADFEQLGNFFDYSRTVSAQRNLPPIHGAQKSDKVTPYLQHIQKAKLIQPFGCLLAIDEKNFQIIACSENAPEMLTMSTHAVPTLGDHPSVGIGTDIRTLFTSPSSAALQKAIGFGEVSLLNPILLHCKTSGKPFYGILHRVTGCLVIDFEPVKPCDLPITAAGALKSYKLAAKAISRLQSLPTGSTSRLCDTIVREVFELTGYDRVMVYKFHEDDHGEVVSELTKPGLDSYLGLHYPATDIPQASRFLFMKNKVRMICDCHANPVKVHQDERLHSDLTFCGSTLRAPHGCHAQYMANMNATASLVMAVVINEDEDASEPNPPEGKKKRLWGLVVCHNVSPRFIPFPLRYACEFLAQVFATHVNMELELENQIHEKNVLRTQTVLCDMLITDALLGIISQSPNIMDLVKCDGAVLLYQNKIWRLGNCPSEPEILSISDWLAECHMDSTGLSTDSLHDAGYPGSLSLGNAVCGMAAARINSRDIVFWFRSHTAAEVRWGGAKHEPGERDDGRRMHPRSSFNAFLDVVKMRSFPWKDFEMDAIHSLQLILREKFSDAAAAAAGKGKEKKTSDDSDEGTRSNEDNPMFASMMELKTLTKEMIRLIETATVPILAVDAVGCVNGWNLKIAELTGLQAEQAIGKNLLSLVEDSSSDTVESILNLALQGHEEKNVKFELKTHGAAHGTEEEAGPVLFIVNACASRDLNGDVVGVCFVAQDLTSYKLAMDKFTRIEGDYKAIVQNPNPLIPPIFGVDEFGWCSEWNSAMTKISGWSREEMLDKMLLGEIFGTHMVFCRLKNQDALVNLSVLINTAMTTGQTTEQIPFTFLNRDGKYVECLLSITKKTNPKDAITGVFCFLHIASRDLQKSIHLQRLSEQSISKQLKALSYIRHEINNPLSGMMFARNMMLESTELNEEQRRLTKTGEKCHLQLNKILGDLDLDSTTDSCLDLDMSEFVLNEMLVTAISQVMIPSRNKSVRIMHDLSEELMAERFYGDCLRLQQIVSDFLLVSVNSCLSGGQVEIVASVVRDKLGKALYVANLELRISHTGGRVPETLLSQMFGNDEGESEEGISLLICRKLLTLMNGDVRYLSEAGKSSFIISVELASSNQAM